MKDSFYDGLSTFRVLLDYEESVNFDIEHSSKKDRVSFSFLGIHLSQICLNCIWVKCYNSLCTSIFILDSNKEFFRRLFSLLY